MAAAAPNVTEHLAGERVSLSWPATLLRRMDAYVAEGFGAIPRGGVEVGGVLFGKRESDDNFEFVEFRPLACEYSTGPSFVLSERDIEGIPGLLASADSDPELEGLAPVAWFHSHTRSDVEWTAADAELHARCFPGLIALVFRPRGLQPTEVAVFVPDENGTISPGPPAERFEVERRGRNLPDDREEPPPPVTAAPSLSPQEERNSVRAPLLLAISGAATALLMIAAWQWYAAQGTGGRREVVVFGVPAVERRTTQIPAQPSPTPAVNEAKPEREPELVKPATELPTFAPQPAAESEANRNREPQLVAASPRATTPAPTPRQPSVVPPPSLNLGTPAAGPPLPAGIGSGQVAPGPPPARRAPSSGRAIWLGSLPRGGTLSIVRGRAQFGTLSGRWPERPARVRVHAAELGGGGMIVYTGDPALRSRSGTAESPNARNGWNLTTWQWDPKRATAVQVVEQPSSDAGRLTVRSGSNVAMLILEWDELPQP